MLRAVIVFVAACTLAALPAGVHGYCQPSQPCWPTTAEVAALTAQLDPTANRSLVYDGAGTPYPCSVPVGSPGYQPLYGEGKSLDAVYTSTVQAGQTCFIPSSFHPTTCVMSIRNVPYFGWTPAFVVWPLTAAHVQAAVAFARHHNMSVCVAGTGHDFLNRHSCNQGVMIRTSLLSSIAPVGTHALRVGAGVTFSQVQYAAAARDQYVASGWAATVGIAGWSTGGGHGPFSPSAGLGVDNILEVEMVLANGSLVVANTSGTCVVRGGCSDDTSLLWALRGGGGSTWGVMTALTIRAYDTPVGGFTFATATWEGTLCPDGLKAFNSLLEGDLKIKAGLGSKWGGLTFATPKKKAAGQECGTWSYFLEYIYSGPRSDAAFAAAWQAWMALSPAPATSTVSQVANVWGLVGSLKPEEITPISLLGPKQGSSFGGVPSVLLSRDAVAQDFGPLVQSLMEECAATNSECVGQQMYQDITGNNGSPQQSFTSTSDGMRTSLLHVVFTSANETTAQRYFDLGANSYFSESAFVMQDWQARYWGADNYARLLQIKRDVDPTSLFGCHHCVGDTSSM